MLKIDNRRREVLVERVVNLVNEDFRRRISNQNTIERGHIWLINLVEEDES